MESTTDKLVPSTSWSAPGSDRDDAVEIRRYELRIHGVDIRYERGAASTDTTCVETGREEDG